MPCTRYRALGNQDVSHDLGVYNSKVPTYQAYSYVMYVASIFHAHLLRLVQTDNLPINAGWTGGPQTPKNGYYGKRG